MTMADTRPSPPSLASAVVPDRAIEHAKIGAVVTIGTLMLVSAAKIYRAFAHEFVETHKRTRKW